MTKKCEVKLKTPKGPPLMALNLQWTGLQRLPHANTPTSPQWFYNTTTPSNTNTDTNTESLTCHYNKPTPTPTHQRSRRRRFCNKFPKSTPPWWRHHNTIMVVSQVVIHNPKYEHNNISQLRLRSWPIHCERQVYKSLFVHEIVRCWDRVPCHCQAIFKFYVLHFIIDIPQKTQTRTLR